MSDSMVGIVGDLVTEQQRVAALIADFNESDWERQACSCDWTFKDEILHIGAFDYAAVVMMEGKAENVRVFADPYFQHDERNRVMRFRHLGGHEVAEKWRTVRERMNTLLLERNPRDRIAWAPGLPMAARSLASARLMELWAHSVDITDALGMEPVVEERITATLFLSWQARPYAYHINRLQLPDTPMYLDIELPSGTRWTKGKPEAANYIKGTAKDWALVAVRRRNWMDMGLEVVGAEARRYASLVQTFAGDATPAVPAAKNLR
jgi:uncharacterized protein (TIGR03084 family)